MNDSHKTEDSGDEAADLEDSDAWSGVGVLEWGEHSQNIVVFMKWLAVVTTLLLVPPVGVWIAELALNSRWVDIAAVLRNIVRILSVKGHKLCAWTDHAWVLNLLLGEESLLDGCSRASCLGGSTQRRSAAHNGS